MANIPNITRTVLNLTDDTTLNGRKIYKLSGDYDQMISYFINNRIINQKMYKDIESYLGPGSGVYYQTGCKWVQRQRRGSGPDGYYTCDKTVFAHNVLSYVAGFPTSADGNNFPFSNKIRVLSGVPYPNTNNFVGPKTYQNWNEFVDDTFWNNDDGWTSSDFVPRLFGLDNHKSYWLYLQSKLETPTHFIVNYIYWETPNLVSHFTIYSVIIQKRLDFSLTEDYNAYLVPQLSDTYGLNYYSWDWNFDVKHGAELQKIKVGTTKYKIKGQNKNTQTTKTREITTIKDPNELKSISTPIKNVDFQTAKYVKKFFQQTFVWGFKNHPNLIYFSDFDNYCYFPEYNKIEISKNKEEIIQNIVFFQNSVLIVFTNRSIYMIKQVLGTNKEFVAFQVVKINSTLGTPFRKSIKTIGAYVYFIGADLRVYALKSLYNTTPEEKFNVQIIDDKITNFLKPKLKNKLNINPNRLFAVSHNLEYQLYFDNYRFRYYTETELQCWTYDESSLFGDTIGGFSKDGDLFLITKDKIFIQNEDVQTDNKKPIEFVLTTPQYDFDKPHHRKSFKKVFLQLSNTDQTEPITLGVSVKVDDMIIRASRIDRGIENGLEYQLENNHQDNVSIGGFTGTAGSLITLNDALFPANDRDLGEPISNNDKMLLNKYIGQKKIYASGKGIQFQLELRYSDITKLTLHSIGFEMRIKSAK